MKILWKLITTNTGVGGVGEQGKFHYTFSHVSRSTQMGEFGKGSQSRRGQKQSRGGKRPKASG